MIDRVGLGAPLTKIASDCVGYRVRKSRCPYHLPTREMLTRAVEVIRK